MVEKNKHSLVSKGEIVMPDLPQEFLDKLPIRSAELICPQCKKGVGGKGLEVRIKKGDAFCHSCHKTWQLELQPVISVEQADQ
jgi:transposase-like protein